MKYSNKVRINEEKNPGSKSTRNMNAVDNVNQKSGPRTGNAGTPAKRAKFVKEKASSGNEKSALANMITDALTGRGTGMQGKIDKTVEGLHADTGPKRNPTAGGTKYKITGRK